MIYLLSKLAGGNLAQPHSWGAKPAPVLPEFKSCPCPKLMSKAKVQWALLITEGAIKRRKT